MGHDVERIRAGAIVEESHQSFVNLDGRHGVNGGEHQVAGFGEFHRGTRTVGVADFAEN